MQRAFRSLQARVRPSGDNDAVPHANSGIASEAACLLSETLQRSTRGDPGGDWTSPRVTFVIDVTNTISRESGVKRPNTCLSASTRNWPRMGSVVRIVIAESFLSKYVLAIGTELQLAKKPFWDNIAAG